jgi:transposase
MARKSFAKIRSCEGRDEIAERGHRVRLMSPRFVRPYVKSNKNDARDASVLRWLEERLKRYDLRIASLARTDERAAR